jgi:hypothetical protein
MTESSYIVESEIIIRAVDKPFHERQVLGVFVSSEIAYQFVEKYIEDSKNLHTYFSRSIVCSKEDYEENIVQGKLVAINIVLGQFEDMIYVRKTSA